MGVVHPSSEGVPGGLSADGQRRRMAGCGAPSRSVSRSSPSIPRTFPVKRLRRYSTDSLLSHSPSLFSASLSVYSCSAVHNPTYMHVTQTYTAWVINRFYCESETLCSGSSCIVLIQPENSKPAYYNRPSWLYSQPEDGEPLLCAFSLKLLFFFFPTLPDYFSVHPFLTHFCISISITFPRFSFSLSVSLSKGCNFSYIAVFELYTKQKTFM